MIYAVFSGERRTARRMAGHIIESRMSGGILLYVYLSGFFFLPRSMERAYVAFGQELAPSPARIIRALREGASAVLVHSGDAVGTKRSLAKILIATLKRIRDEDVEASIVFDDAGEISELRNLVYSDLIMDLALQISSEGGSDVLLATREPSKIRPRVRYAIDEAYIHVGGWMDRQDAKALETLIEDAVGGRVDLHERYGGKIIRVSRSNRSIEVADVMTDIDLIDLDEVEDHARHDLYSIIESEPQDVGRVYIELDLDDYIRLNQRLKWQMQKNSMYRRIIEEERSQVIKLIDSLIDGLKRIRARYRYRVGETAEKMLRDLEERIRRGELE